MFKIQIFLTIMGFSIIPILATSCTAQEKYHPGGPYYYGDFATYKVPFRPIEELTPDEAKKRDSYYVAYFNENGKIISFTKYLYGKIEFNDKYIYNADGSLDRRELTKSTGEVSVQYFDKNGKLIPSK